MLQIRWGLEDGIDASIYANPKFDYNQMEKIKIGLQTRENEVKSKEKQGLEEDYDDII